MGEYFLILPGDGKIKLIYQKGKKYELSKIYSLKILKYIQSILQKKVYKEQQNRAAVEGN